MSDDPQITYHDFLGTPLQVGQRALKAVKDYRGVGFERVTIQAISPDERSVYPISILSDGKTKGGWTNPSCLVVMRFDDE